MKIFINKEKDSLVYVVDGEGYPFSLKGHIGPLTAKEVRSYCSMYHIPYKLSVYKRVTKPQLKEILNETVH